MSRPPPLPAASWLQICSRILVPLLLTMVLVIGLASASSTPAAALVATSDHRHQGRAPAIASGNVGEDRWKSKRDRVVPQVRRPLPPSGPSDGGHP
ncbi:unnamed protein product [Alopecurus aequalis]